MIVGKTPSLFGDTADGKNAFPEALGAAAGVALVAAGVAVSSAPGSLILPAISHVFTISYVADKLGEDAEWNNTGNDHGTHLLMPACQRLLKPIDASLYRDQPLVLPCR
jgi:hypothetical protein